jgi:hypothetical protein
MVPLTRHGASAGITWARRPCTAEVASRSKGPSAYRMPWFGCSVTDCNVLALQPLFYSTPIEDGGLGFTPATIGFWMSCQGVANGIIQAFFFAPLISKLGAKDTVSDWTRSICLFIRTLPHHPYDCTEVWYCMVSLGPPCLPTFPSVVQSMSFCKSSVNRVRLDRCSLCIPS